MTELQSQTCNCGGRLLSPTIATNIIKSIKYREFEQHN